MQGTYRHLCLGSLDGYSWGCIALTLSQQDDFELPVEIQNFFIKEELDQKNY
jgi:hypothetical protein